MVSLDETDIEILSLLADDARRPFSQIGEQVGLSGPAVSDRVTRLEEAGVIDQFTIALDRSQLQGGVSVMIQIDLPESTLEPARERLRSATGVDHLFVTAEGDLWCYARVDARSVRDWLDSLLGDLEGMSYSVTLIDAVEWTQSVEGMAFGLTCAECSNTVDSEGETARIDGDTYHFCCPSCRTRFEERYRELEEGA